MMRNLAAAVGTIALVVSLAFVSCSSGPNACEQLAEKCHHLGSSSGFGHECHELGHDGVVAECSEQLSACLAVCTMPASDGGSDTAEASAGATDTGQD
jgi:hypothetical protein